MEPTKLERLHRSYSRDAELDEAFIVLTVGASLIATLGLLANSTAVVIGAMVVAPWIHPLRASAFAVLLGRVRLLGRSLSTLAIGVVLTTVLSAVLGALVALPQFGSEVTARTMPNLLDLGIALVAGGLASYAKMRSDAVSSLAGTAIAVALVPPVCVMGLLLSQQNWSLAAGAGLLFSTNLLGILTGGLMLMAWKDPFFREQLTRSRLSAASFALTGLLVVPLGSSFISLLQAKNQDNIKELVEITIRRFLEDETITFGDVKGVPESEAVNLESVRIDWDVQPPVIRALVSVSDPRFPTFTQVKAVQKEINKRQRMQFQLVVERTAVEVVGPPPKTPTIELDSRLDQVLLPQPTEAGQEPSATNASTRSDETTTETEAKPADREHRLTPEPAIQDNVTPADAQTAPQRPPSSPTTEGPQPNLNDW
ncbi:DUF389 domain-containing protein [Synechococcus sp. UW140]|uniref:DUF389 domain-containing protein n=1 Tax=Synechococcus sp. UW140 TaxID=368503 RepID=UPI001FCC75C7|nr:DUF389 domain-containing protein [Synechococcus sp. UW140]